MNRLIQKLNEFVDRNVSRNEDPMLASLNGFLIGGVMLLIGIFVLMVIYGIISIFMHNFLAGLIVVACAAIPVTLSILFGIRAKQKRY